MRLSDAFDGKGASDADLLYFESTAYIDVFVNVDPIRLKITADFEGATRFDRAVRCEAPLDEDLSTL